MDFNMLFYSNLFNELVKCFNRAFRLLKKIATQYPRILVVILGGLNGIPFLSPAGIGEEFATLIHVLVCVSVAAFFLATIMGVRFKRSKKIIPAGLVAGLR